MYPSCDSVEYATTRLMSFCTMPIRPVQNAVVAPMNSTKLSAVSLSENSGDMRATMKMPAVTMVAAWISAEIGVGPSIESGSHTCSGTCADLPIAPTNRLMQITVAMDHSWPAEDLHGLPAADPVRGVGEHGRVIHCAEPVQHACDTQQEAEVADAIDQERLEVGEDRRRPFEPEADEQVRHQTHRFPAEETAA